MRSLAKMYQEFNQLRMNIISISSETERIANEKKQEKLANEIEDVLTKKSSSPFPNSPYYTDPHFNAKISTQSKYAVWTSSPAAAVSKNKFVRTDSQNFVRSYIHPNSPYQSLLLWHGTGVGKTCSAIGIAEQHKHDTFKRGKKIWILCPKSLISTWYNEIFNMYKMIQIIRDSSIDPKTKKTLLQNNQCTGSAYASVFQSVVDLDDIPKTEKKMKRHIDKYYQIVNYEKFLGVIAQLRSSLSDNSEGKMIQSIKKHFNHTMLILDEAHTIRKTYTPNQQNISSLKTIRSIRIPQGNVVKIMSTKDSKNKKNTEISIKKDTASFSEQFSGVQRIERISGTGDIILYEKTKFKGKSIIMSGETQSFNVKKTTKTIVDVLRYIARHSDHMKLLLLSATPLYDNSNEILELINLCRMNDKRPTWTQSKVFPKDISLTKSSHPLYAFSRGYISYVRGENPDTFPLVVYPHGTQVRDVSPIRIYESTLSKNQVQLLDLKKVNSDIDPSNKMISTILFPDGGYNNESFHSQFISSTASPPYRQPLIKGKSMFTSSIIKSYSPKYKNVLKNVLQCQGIVFIYTEYLVTGAYTLAMMLEENGFTRYSTPKYPRPAMLNNISTTGQKITKKGQYVIFDQSHTGEISSLLDAINSVQNNRGQNIKVIIGTRRIEQGISFKNVRQIHIMTPWWNMNRNKQIIGRGSRTFSHLSLPKEERNVTIFYHVGTNATGNSPDLRTYEKALKKQAMIDAVEQILRENSVDCIMNAHLNQYVASNQNVVDSFGKNRMIQPNDIVTSDVQYTCSTPSSTSEIVIKNTDEIRPKIDHLYRIIHQKMFPRRGFSTKKNMIARIRKLCKEHSIHSQIIPIALHTIIEEKKDIYRGDTAGYLGFQNNYYIFIPQWNSNRYMTMLYREIVPQKILRETKAITGVTQNVTKRQNKSIEKLCRLLKEVPQYINRNYSFENYTQVHLKKFVLQRQMMLIDEMRTDDREQLLHSWQLNELGDVTNVVAQYFGTETTPSVIDNHVGRMNIKGKTYYRFLNRDGIYKYFEGTSTKSLSDEKTRFISANFPRTQNEMKDIKYIGFRSHVKGGEQSVLKIISSDSYSRRKKRKSGCMCSASGLGKKPEVQKLLSTLKTYLLRKRTISNFEGVHQSSRISLKSRTLCEEIELLFRTIAHKDVQFISLRDFNIKKMK